jgi:hypothetical protein
MRTLFLKMTLALEYGRTYLHQKYAFDRSHVKLGEGVEQNQKRGRKIAKIASSNERMDVPLP